MAEQKSPLENLMIMSQRLDQLDGQFDWSDEIQQIRAALSHAEGEAVSVPPFATKIIEKLRRFDECAQDGEGADIGRHWFDILTRLGLLNRVQRSPALWELSQQGEDVLEGYTHSAPQVAVPEGWALVPVKITPEMRNAALDATDDECRGMDVAWPAAVAAAPTAPAGDIPQLTAYDHSIPVTATSSDDPALDAPASLPEIGSRWRHRDGHTSYTVESITNGETERPGQYPVTIVYRGGNGKLWSRPAHDWHRSMTFESAPVAQQLVSDPDGLADDVNVVYRWRALDYSGYCYGSKPPRNLPGRACLKAFHRQPDAFHRALHEIQGTLNVTATDEQFARHLKKIASDALKGVPAPAPDEREIGLKWSHEEQLIMRGFIGRLLVGWDENPPLMAGTIKWLSANRDRFISKYEMEAAVEAARLRAGKEGEQS